MKIRLKQLNFFAYYQTDYKGHLNTKFETMYFDSFDKEQKYKIYRRDYHKEYDEKLYKLFNIILFVDKEENSNEKFKDEAWISLCDKAKEFGAEETKFYYAYSPYSGLFHYYKEIKNSTDLFYSYGIDLNNTEERKEIRLRQTYFGFMREVYDEVINNKLFYGKSELEKEYVNICTVKNVQNNLKALDSELTNTKQEKTNLKNDLDNIIPISRKFDKEDFDLYSRLYSENGCSWKRAFYKLQEITSNRFIKKTTYNSFQTSYNEYNKKIKRF